MQVSREEVRNTKDTLSEIFNKLIYISKCFVTSLDWPTKERSVKSMNQLSYVIRESREIVKNF